MSPHKRKRRETTLEWATRQLEEMARTEANPALKALWLRAAARGYELDAQAALERAAAYDAKRAARRTNNPEGINTPRTEP